MNISKKILLGCLSLIGYAGYSTAQEQLTLKCEQIGEIKGEDKFAAEDGWLMLTTDLYILNPESFKQQLETLYPGRKDKEKIKSVFISAQMPSTTVATDVRYPLYNLTVDVVNKELTINKTNTQGKIRIAENVPLGAVGTNPVEMKFTAQAINADQTNNILQFATRQLSQIGKVKNDYSAMNSVSQEIGKLIDANIKGQQFVFNSTVSLFGEMDVETKLYSICLYEFAPSNKDIERNFTNAKLKKCVSENEKVDYSVIRGGVTKKNAPIIVAVNYKSVYKPSVRKAGQISADYVNQRMVMTRNLYASKVMSEDVYSQEDKLNEFMNKYLEFNKETTRYKEGKVRGDKRIAPNSIIDSYHDLMNTMMLKTVKDEYLYRTTYKKHYEEIMETAKGSLKDGKELETVGKLVEVLVMGRDADTLPAQKLKDNFNVLLNAKTVVEETKWETNVEDITENYEYAYYEKIYKSKLEKLMQGDMKSNEALCKSLKAEIEASQCRYCMFQAQESYFEPYEELLNNIQAEEKKKEADAKKAEMRAKAKAKAAAKKKKK